MKLNLSSFSRHRHFSFSLKISFHSFSQSISAINCACAIHITIKYSHPHRKYDIYKMRMGCIGIGGSDDVISNQTISFRKQQKGMDGMLLFLQYIKFWFWFSNVKMLIYSSALRWSCLHRQKWFLWNPVRLTGPGPSHHLMRTKVYLLHGDVKYNIYNQTHVAFMITAGSIPFFMQKWREWKYIYNGKVYKEYCII